MTTSLIIAAVGALLVVGLASWSLWAARRQARVLGWRTYRDCVSATRTLGRYSTRIRTLTGLKWLCFIGGLWLLFRMWRGAADPAWWPVAFGLVAIGLIQWARQRVPACILVLGGSTPDQLALQAAIRDAVLPFRPVSLLQTGDHKIDMTIAGDCFRVDDEHDWRKTVFAFCDALPVLALDLRRLTPFVEMEIEHIVSAPYLYKTLFIAAPEDDRRLTEMRRRLNPRDVATPVLCVPDSATATAFLRHLFFVCERMPSESPNSSLAHLSHEWAAWREGKQLQPAGGTVTAQAVRVACDGLAPFSYVPPAGWGVTVSRSAKQYAALFRPPGESGSRNVLKRRSRLDLMVFPYPDGIVSDEATLRRGTEHNVAQRGGSITRERMGQRCSVLSHECFYQRGTGLAYLIRFIVQGNEFVVHWMSMDRVAMERHLPEVDRFVDTLRV